MIHLILARKKPEGSMVESIMSCESGGLNIDACRVGGLDARYKANCSGDRGHSDNRKRDLGFKMGCGKASDIGRFPSNVIHDGSESVISSFPDNAGAFAPVRRGHNGKSLGIYGDFAQKGDDGESFRGDSGSASRFFWSF